MTEPTVQRRLLIDTTISYGHIMQVVAIIIPIIIWGIRVETRQNHVEEKISTINRELARNEELVRERLIDIKQSLNRIEIKVDGKLDRPVNSNNNQNGVR